MIIEFIIHVIFGVIIEYLIEYPGIYIYKWIFARNKTFEQVREENAFATYFIGALLIVFLIILIVNLMN